VKVVNYPGLPTHERHEVAKKQMRGFGGMLSFQIKGSGDDAIDFAKRLKLVRYAPSLGGLDTILCLPCQTSHSSFSKEERQKLGIEDNLIRVSVGIEDFDDIVADFEQSLNQIP
jgi:cystathionine beta-lyase/cystathionine gamma-synthase